jgi:hypothetical protein
MLASLEQRYWAIMEKCGKPHDDQMRHMRHWTVKIFLETWPHLMEEWDEARERWAGCPEPAVEYS